MTFTHDDIQKHLIEFLYDELDVELRAAFGAHTAACEACRADVAAFVSTRAAVRTVVRAPLGDSVPPSVRARVMESAVRTAAERRTVGHAVSPVARGGGAAAGPTTRTARQSKVAGWWVRLRGRWTLPLFATVAAMATLLLGRETIFREAHRPLGGTSPAEVAPPLPVAPSKPASENAPEVHRLAGQEPGVATRREPDEPARVTPADRTKRSRDHNAKKYEAPARLNVPHREASPKSVSHDALVLGNDQPVPTRPAKSARADEAEADQRVPARGAVDSFLDVDEGVAVRAGAGVPQASATASAPAPASAPAAALAKGRSSSMEAPAVASADRGLAGSVRASQASEHEAVAPDPAITLSERADKLMTTGRFSDAVVAYRDLLQRFPAHRFVAAWRGKLAAAQAAAARQPDSGRFATPPPPR